MKIPSLSKVALGSKFLEAAAYPESKKAIGDKLMELGQLFHKPESDHHSKLTAGQLEPLV